MKMDLGKNKNDVFPVCQYSLYGVNKRYFCTYLRLSVWVTCTCDCGLGVLTPVLCLSAVQRKAIR